MKADHQYFILAPTVIPQGDGYDYANASKKLYTYRIAKVVNVPESGPDEWSGVAYRVLYDPTYAGQCIENYRRWMGAQQQNNTEARNANTALALIHLVPLGAAVDNASQGDWGEATLSVVGDLTMVLGIGAAFKTGRSATVLMRGSQVGEAGIAGVRAGIAGVRIYQGVRDFNGPNPEEGYAQRLSGKWPCRNGSVRVTLSAPVPRGAESWMARPARRTRPT